MKQYPRISAVSLALAILLLASCATRQIAEPAGDLAELAPEEGLLLLVLHSPNDADTRFFFRGTGTSMETPGLPKGLNGQLLRMPAGDYEMTALYVGAIKLLAEDFLTFSIQPGHLTYPGDLVMDGLTFRLVDRADQRLSGLLQDNTQLQEWPIIVGSDVIENRRRIYDGTRRVPNTGGRIDRDSSN